CEPAEARANLPVCAGRERVFVALWRAGAIEISCGASFCDDGGWRAAFGGLRAGGIHDGPFRREFELARASVVSDEFSADRIHAADSLLLRRRVPGGMPDGRAAPHAMGRGGRDFA